MRFGVRMVRRWLSERGLEVDRPCLGPPFQLADNDGTFVLGLVEHLTMQAGDALVRIDLTGGVDRLNGAFVGAGLTGAAAIGIAAQPVEHADTGGDRQRSA